MQLPMIYSFDERLLKLREEITASPDNGTKFNIWVNNAADICHDIATSKEESIQVDRFFMAFQSPPIATVYSGQIDPPFRAN
jgi:hypothetical protein